MEKSKQTESAIPLVVIIAYNELHVYTRAAQDWLCSMYGLLKIENERFV
jgi:hypothetical protein